MLTEISLNVIDIVRNSIRAGASRIRIEISIDKTKNELRLLVADNGSGMSEEQLRKVTDPFFTSRSSRNVGLGIPFLKQAAECTGGTFAIKSEPGIGTEVLASFNQKHIDCMPLGDINESIYSLIITSNEIDYVYTYSVDDRSFTLDTAEMRRTLGGIPMQNPEVSSFIRSYLKENTDEVNGN